MRALLTAFGTLGDLQPLVAMGLCLKARGHEVHLIGSPSGAALAARLGLSAAPLGLDVEALLLEAASGEPGVLRRLREAWPRLIEDQLERLSAHAPWADLLLSGVGALAASSVADAHQRPHRSLLFSPRALPSRHHAPLAAPVRGAPPWLNRAMWWAEGQLLDHPARPLLQRRRAAWGLPPLPDRHAALAPPGRTWVLVDPALYPLPPDVEAEAVGYWPLPTDPEPLPAELLAFLDAGPPPLWVGWGSMADPDPARSTRLLLQALRQSGQRAVIGRGQAGLGDLDEAGAVDPTEIFVARPVDHRALFPRLGGALHHGGAGTLATAARAGIPQGVCWQLPDQRDFGQRAFELGLGPAPMPLAGLALEPLTRALRALAEPQHLAASRALAQRLEGEDPLIDAAARLERLAAAAPPPQAVAWQAPRTTPGA